MPRADTRSRGRSAARQMMWRLALTALFLCLSALPSAAASGRRPRRRLGANESILEHVQSEHRNGVPLPEFTIAAVSSDRQEVDFDVVEAVSSVTSATTYSIGDGPVQPVGDLGMTVLVSDPSEGGEGYHGLTVVTIEEDTGQVHGVSQIEGTKPMSISQPSPEDMVTLSETDDFDPPDWSCGVAGDFVKESGVPNTNAESSAESLSSGSAGKPDTQYTKPISQIAETGHKPPLAQATLPHEGLAVQEVPSGHRRHLENGQLNRHVFHRHDGHHNRDHVHLPSASHVHISANMMDTLSSELRHNVQGSHGGHHNYPTDDFPKRWSNEIQLLIDVDQAFVDKAGGGHFTVAVRYLNGLVSAISATLFEREVDTHLVVQHINLTTLYDGFENGEMLDALLLMQETYGDPNGWHYQEKEIDLHHAMLGNDLGGGIAYVSTLCNSNFGFGISANMEGDFDNAFVWDFFVASHELGHSFGSFHTHDDRQYQPLVDECGLSCDPGGPDPQFPVAPESATIMSYCAACDGGLSNVALTFGGSWDEDFRNNVNNWENANLAGTISTDPRRVPFVMHRFVTSRGECTAPGPDVPSFACSLDEDCHDGRSCTKDTCVDGQCDNTFVDDLCDTCGNFICESGELGCSDCGPFEIVAPPCVGVTDSGPVTSEVQIFTIAGSFRDNFDHPSRWREVTTQTVSANSWQWVTIDFEEAININAASTQALYIQMAEGRVVASQESTDPIVSNEHLSIATPGRYVFELFGGGTSEPEGKSIAWEGSVGYSVLPPCSQDSDCDDGNYCTVDSCNANAGECVNELINNCCGNNVCEISDGESCSADCGPWGLDFDLCFNYGTGECFLFFGMQFDLSVSSESTGISVEAVSLYLNVGTNIQIEFWTKAGEHEGSHNVPEEWDYHSISDAYDLSRVTLVTIPIPPIDIGPGSTQAFYAVLTHAGGDGEGGMLCGTTPAPRVFDNFVEIMSPARVFPTSEPFGEPSFVNFSFQGGITYSAMAITGPTASPSATPTASPTAPPTTAPSESEAPSLPPPLWYMDWDYLFCKEDVAGLQAASWMKLHKSAQECCTSNLGTYLQFHQQCLEISLAERHSAKSDPLFSDP